MSRSGTFKIVLTATLILGVTLGAAWGLAHYLTAKAPLTIVPTAHAAPVPVTAKPTSNSANAGQAMLFTLKAGVSTDDGPVVDISSAPASEACEEPRWLDARNVQTVKPADPLKVESTATWCLRVIPGQPLMANVLPGKWVTLGDRFMEVDAAHQYMRVRHVSGRWLSLRAVAAGYCASESSSCSGTALVEVTIDDENVLVPIMLSSKTRDVLRLTTGAELERVTQQAEAARAARAAAEEAVEVEDMETAPDTPAKPKVDPAYTEVVL